jgi:hypothetical protein
MRLRLLQKPFHDLGMHLLRIAGEACTVAGREAQVALASDGWCGHRWVPPVGSMVPGGRPVQPPKDRNAIAFNPGLPCRRALFRRWYRRPNTAA